MQNYLEQRYFGVKGYEYLCVVAFYFFFAYIYHFTLFFNNFSHDPPLIHLIHPVKFMQQSGLQYLVKLLYSILIWWLLFRKYKALPLKKRILLHLLLLPFWILACQQTYYILAEAIGWWHLVSYGQVWDIYIPALFYVLQFGLLHAYESYHTNQRNLEQKAVLSEVALKSELAAIKAQLNPHFLYNVFNTISASVPAQQEETRELIAKLSDLFRYQLKASKTELVCLSEELDFVAKYLDLEQARFEDRLKIIIDVPLELRTRMVPSMILQPLVENAVKHGIAALVEGGTVSIKIYPVGEQLHFEVSDTGVGVKDKTKLFDVGVGLTNTKLRLEKLYDTTIKISDNLPQGLKVEFAI